MDIETFINVDKIYLFLGIFLVVCFLVIVAIMLDLWDGVYTARKINQRVHSHKLRDTISKMSEYWRFVISGFVLDCFGSFFGIYSLPFITILFGVALVVIEIKSMFEHAHKRKSHTTQLPTVIKEIIHCAKEKDAIKIVEQLQKTGGDYVPLNCDDTMTGVISATESQ